MKANIEALLEVIGSANFGKALGMSWAGLSGSTAVDGKSLAAHISGMTLGGLFTLAVHALDAYRAKIGK